VTNKTDYILAFTLKMVGAVGLFSITFLLALPNEKLKGMQRNRRFWSGLNIVCGLTILIGAALMRAVRNGEL
jgi:arginine exporter protein ArgO